MRVNMKSLTAILFTGVFFQATILNNIHVSPQVMKLSPFYNPSTAVAQPVFSNLASLKQPNQR